MADRKIHWRCFHCGEAFTKAQERWARQHFGANCDALPACQMRVPGEHHLLEILRKMEGELQDRRSEDTDLWRALHSMSADHSQALIQEEEKGYAKGLRDGMAHREAAEPAVSAVDREDIARIIEPHCGPGYRLNSNDPTEQDRRWWSALDKADEILAALV